LIAQIYTIDIAKGNAASIYKPSLQIAVRAGRPMQGDRIYRRVDE